MEQVRRQASPAPEEGGRWAERLVELGRDYQSARTTSERDAILSELWLLLHAALGRYLRRQGGPRLDPEDLQDLASAKCLALLRRFHAGSWTPQTHHPAQICTFLATLARNGLVDRQRRHERRDKHRDAREREGISQAPMPVDTVLRQALVTAIRECADTLSPRARTVWLFRVLYEMPTRDIARHPEVGMAPGAVDVMLSRCRQRVRNCMAEKGLDVHELPPGTFAALWETFRAKLSAEA